MTTELLQFLDGSLAPDAEAELLHRLSVSPERRAHLRSFIKGSELFQRDRNSIAVPYSAEEKLWVRLGEMMPPGIKNISMPAAQTVATASRTGIFAFASVAIVCLLVGLGSGFLVGKNSGSATPLVEQAFNSTPISHESSSIVSDRSNKSYKTYRSHTTYASTENVSPQNSGAPLADNNILQQPVLSIPPIAEASAKEITPAIAADIRDPKDYSAERFITQDEESAPRKTFIQKWEFSFNEDLGKQFPNTPATNVSMPVITNSSIAALYQPFANSNNFLNHFWVGAKLGSANVTTKKLHVELENPLNKNSEYIMVGDLVHTQTTYLGGMLGYRLPGFLLEKMAFYGTWSEAYSTAGLLSALELGLHYDLTREVGFIAGIRGTQISYSLDPSDRQLISDGAAKGLKVPPGVGNTPPSYNVEISSGVYFHFN